MLSKPIATPEMMFVAGPVLEARASSCTGRQAPAAEYVQGDALELPFELLDDGIEVRAPIAGVVAGLRAATHDLAVVIPVDVPRLTAAAVHELAAACRDVAVSPSGPLPGAYRRTALPALELALAENRLRLRDAIGALDVAIVELDARQLVNVNTPDDVRRL